MKRKYITYKAVCLAAAVIAGCFGGVTGVAAEETELNVNDLFGNELPTQEDISLKKVKFVIDGYEFTCPEGYSMTYFAEVGPTVYVEDSFQMKTVVRDYTYEDIVSDPETMTEKSVAAGAVITKEITETEAEGRTVAYYRMDLLGDDTIAMYTASPDSEKCLCGQFVVQNPNLKEEEAVGIFAQVMNSAVPTDQPNSTQEDIWEQIFAPEPMGEVKEESSLSFGNDSVTFHVPEQFYSMYQDESDLYACESFDRETDYASVDIFVYAEPLNSDSAQGYIARQTASYADRTTAEIEIQSRTVGDTEFCGFEVQYTYEDSEVKRVFAACDLPNGGMYLVEAVCFDGEDLTMDSLEKFMEIQ